MTKGQGADLTFKEFAREIREAADRVWGNDTDKSLTLALANLENGTGKDLLREKVDQIFDQLEQINPQAKQVIILKCGLNDGHNMTDEQVAIALGIDTEAVQNLYRDGLNYLHHPSL